MPLSDVQLVPRTRDVRRRKDLVDSWRHVEDILCCFIPRDYRLGEVRKLNIWLPLELPPEPVSIQLGGFGNVSLTDFNAADYLDLPLEEQEEAALQFLERGLKEGIRHFGGEPEALVDAVVKTRASKFRLQFRSRKLSKAHRARRYTGEVLFTYRRGGCDADFRLMLRGKEVLFEERLQSVLLASTAWFDLFRSRWDGDEFVLENRVGTETARIRVPADLLTGAMERPQSSKTG